MTCSRTRGCASCTTGTGSPGCAAAAIRLATSTSETSPTSSRPSSVKASSGVPPARRGGRPGADLTAVAEISLAEAFTGATLRVPSAQPRTAIAAAARERSRGPRRSSARPAGAPARSSTCRRASSASSSARARVRAARVADASSRHRARAAGAGRMLQDRALDVEVPAGIHDGQRIRLRGEGHAGLEGAAGDVFVLVRVRPDERLERDGDDLVATVNVTMVEAALGLGVSVPTPEGTVDLELPPGVARRRPGRARAWDALARPRPARRSAGAGRRPGAAAPHGGAARGARAARCVAGRRGLPGRRLLRAAEERVSVSRPAVTAPVPATERRTALVVVVDEATPLVASFRLRHHRRAVERNIPPHVTILVRSYRLRRSTRRRWRR